MPVDLRWDSDSFFGVKFRGNSSYGGVQRGSKRSFAITMDLTDSKQKLGGYRNLNLLNSNGDASFIRMVLTREIGKNYLPMPKSNWVRVVVNGESWGIYVNQQQQDKIFLKEQFGTKKGRRWKVPGSPDAHGSLNDMGEDLDAYREIYELKSKEDLCCDRLLLQPRRGFRKLLNSAQLGIVVNFREGN